ncbi:hypothetical protein H5410_024591 [Solanum commersonii]|uniref:F-box domain-containing protein n=1 Tax=Solanum commersonii TaxID=4109 RepID=A0A9J5ZMF0_SOLCO|nr:hypothetical protein H5410_024591 [Solanum commersonii]
MISVANFPEDIVKKIFLGCPVKSLLRFKCACKNWSTLIKIPKFIQQHLKNRNPPQLMTYENDIIDDDNHDDFRSITLISEENLQMFIGMKHLLGSVDGLFFMVGAIDCDVSCALWHPCDYGATIHDGPVFGFGLDLLTNDYKVIYFHINYLCEYYASIYSCSRESWRIFKPEIPFFTDVNHMVLLI